MRPDFLVGHSVGEFAAAHVAGVLSLADAARLVVARGQLMEALPEGGAMASVRATEAQVREALVEGVDVAAVNGSSAVVVSGFADAVEEVAGRFAGSKRLRVSHAFHSALMEPMLAGFAEVVSGVELCPAEIPVVSTVTGRVGGLEDPEYWVEQVRCPVRFHDAVVALGEAGVSKVLELGPDGVLSAMAREGLGEGAVVVPALRRNREEEQAFVSALATLHVAGATVRWRFAGADRVALPTYAF
ncbi:acyltransferase domain-containing protein, partial [Nocardiopsis listeri]|uniref:acyltransferase domain-containing protein n=1 Tax=Nocardiopsis listeri TaxID=53440 RepID=UPI0021E039D9